MDDELREFLRHSLRSVWNIELLLLLARHQGRSWPAGDLVRELRASDLVVSQGVDGLQQAGLIIAESGETYRYAPASPNLDRLVQQLERVYRERPSAVTKALFSSPTDRLTTFADAFRLKKD
ncbi:hypothetical protein ACFOYU_08015 [Microvirga sp. GCM10011540]|uniref:hypothetical protein n=1 Tax=Microvirga sp. GCM10011540 TaxID=3317338 RepID=UPI00361C1C76